MEFELILLPPFGPVVAFIWGAIWGSFANVAIYRMPLGQSVAWPGSRCMSCKTELSAWNNIPIFSYIFLRGKCAYCKKEFSPRYAIIEALIATVTLLLYYTSPLASGIFTATIALNFLGNFFFILILIILSFIDWDTFILPDVLVVPLILSGWGISVLLGNQTPFMASAGMVLGYGLFYITGLAYRIIKKSEGLALGDAKLLCAIGAWLGPMAVAPVILLASFQGLLFALLASLFKFSWPNPKPYKGITDNDDEFREFQEFVSNKEGSWRMKPLPFGPFLALGAIEFILFNPQIISLMTKFFSLNQ
jgi:leader peptidase (prepilin peptidase) / N-methyltransferase